MQQTGWFKRASPTIATISMVLLGALLITNLIQSNEFISTNQMVLGSSQSQIQDGAQEVSHSPPKIGDLIMTSPNETLMKQIQKERKRHLRQVCTSMGLTPNYTSPLTIHRQLDHIFVFPKYKLLYCAIPKVSCTSWKRLFLVLHGYRNFLDPSDENAPHKVADREFKKLSDLTWSEAKRVLDEYTTFVFVRNPYSRILSAYRDKFVLLGDGGPWGKWRADLRQWYRLNHLPLRDHPVTEEDISFERFVTYFNKAPAKNGHWEDMLKLCHPCHVRYNFIGHYETLKQDSDYILDQIKAPKSIRFPDAQRTPTQSSSDDILHTYYSQLSEHTFQELLKDRGLQTDMELFNYDIPKCIKRE